MPAVLVLLVLLVLLAAGAWFGVGAARRAYYPMKYTQYVEEYSAANGLEEELVYAIIRCESSFEPDAVSSVGARGLMQLMESAFDWVKSRTPGEEAAVYDDMYDPETNIRYGCRLFGLLLEEYGTPRNALCAYHAGWGMARQWLEDPRYSPDGKNIEKIPYEDTAYYVEKVMKTAGIYQELYDL